MEAPARGPGFPPPVGGTMTARVLFTQFIHRLLSRRSALALVLTAALVSAVPASAAEIQDAVQEGNIAKVRELLKNDPKLASDASEYDARGFKTLRTPLHYAAYTGNTEMIELLLDYHADVNAKDMSGVTPLHLAAAEGHPEAVRLLLAAKADPNARDSKIEATPLLLATASGFRETVAILLDSKANVNAQDHVGMSALAVACGRGYKPIVIILLDHKANVNIRDKTGLTPLQLAHGAGHKDIEALLKQHGASDAVN
jgi:ankyrin repeat protein